MLGLGPGTDATKHGQSARPATRQVPADIFRKRAPSLIDKPLKSGTDVGRHSVKKQKDLSLIVDNSALFLPACSATIGAGTTAKKLDIRIAWI